MKRSLNFLFFAFILLTLKVCRKTDVPLKDPPYADTEKTIINEFDSRALMK